MSAERHRDPGGRATCIAELAAWLAELGAPRVALDGPDAAGKTTLAGELESVLSAQHGRAVVRVSADEYQASSEQRHRRGRASPEGYLLDAFDQEALRRTVLAASSSAIVLVDGVFLQRPPLIDLWDAAVWVAVGAAEILSRALTRDVERFGSADEVRRLYEARYLPAQRMYAERWRPMDAADAVLENDDPSAPRLSWRSPG